MRRPPIPTTPVLPPGSSKSRKRTRLTAAATGLLAVVLLAGCTSGDAPSSATSGGDTQCDASSCSGTLDGAQFEVLRPTTWNGTLLIYSHGYRPAQPVPPDLTPVSTAAEPAPGWSSGNRQVAEALLAQGYLLAGSGYASNGWAVADGVRAAEGLIGYVTNTLGAPERVYLWGDSLGGLISEVTAERNPDLVDAVAPLCAPLAGAVPNLDLGLDVAYAVRTLLVPGLKVDRFASYQQALTSLTRAGERILDIASRPESPEASALLLIAALADAPTQTQRYDGASRASQVAVAAESILTALAFSTYARYDLEQRFGGAISGNRDTDYAARLDAPERQLLEASAPGRLPGWLQQLADGQRIIADPAAVDRARTEGGDPSGDITVPTITMHTNADPLVIVANESFFRGRVESADAAGRGDADLLEQLITVAPDTYPQGPGAPYGAGHCNFTPDSRIGVVALLDDWVRTGQRPTTATIRTALGPDSGYDPDAVVGPWPADPTR